MVVFWGASSEARRPPGGRAQAETKAPRRGDVPCLLPWGAYVLTDRNPFKPIRFASVRLDTLALVPALPPVASVMRMQLKFTYGSDTDVLTHSYWKYTNPPPNDAALVTMATSLQGTLAAPMAGIIGSHTTWTEIVLVDLASATSPVGSYSFSTAGTRTGALLPASAAADIAFSISRRYRGGKPHTSQPWGTDTDLNNPQQWTPAFVTACNTVWSDVQAAMTSDIYSGGGPIAQVNVSYYGPPNRTVTSSTGRVRTISTTRTTPLVDTINSFGTQLRLGTVRRRLGKAA